MKKAHTLKLAANGDREIVMTRDFDAPRRLVFEALIRPEFLRRWLLGPPGWTMTVCDIDFQVGGTYRYVWKNEEAGYEMGMGGVYREIVPGERIVSTEKFDQSWYPGEAVGTIQLVEKEGRTTLTSTILYDTKEARDAVLQSPMEQGVAAGYDRLDDVLASMPEG